MDTFLRPAVGVGQRTHPQSRLFSHSRQLVVPWSHVAVGPGDGFPILGRSTVRIGHGLSGSHVVEISLQTSWSSDTNHFCVFTWSYLRLPESSELSALQVERLARKVCTPLTIATEPQHLTTAGLQVFYTHHPRPSLSQINATNMTSGILQMLTF